VFCRFKTQFAVRGMSSREDSCRVGPGDETGDGSVVLGRHQKLASRIASSASMSLLSRSVENIRTYE